MAVTGQVRLQRALTRLRDKFNSQELSAVVGFTQTYAVIVHEDLGARHKEGKTAKYLERPAREIMPTAGKTIADVYKKTGSLDKGLIVVCLQIQRAAQQVVPIDTAALKASAFTALESKYDQTASDAFAKSEAVRVSTLEARTEKAKRKRFKDRYNLPKLYKKAVKLENKKARTQKKLATKRAKAKAKKQREKNDHRKLVAKHKKKYGPKKGKK